MVVLLYFFGFGFECALFNLESSFHPRYWIMSSTTALRKQKVVARVTALKAGKELGRHTPKLKTQEPVNVIPHLESKAGAIEESG